MDVAVLERERRLALTDRGRLGLGLIKVLGMQQVEVGRLDEFLQHVAEHVLHGRVDAREVPLEVGHRDQIGREVEDPVKLVLRLGSPGAR